MEGITTNKVQPKAVDSKKKLRILTTNDIDLEKKRADFQPKAFPEVDKRETRKVDVGLLTAENCGDTINQEFFIFGTLNSGELVGLYAPDWEKEPVRSRKKK